MRTTSERTIREKSIELDTESPMRNHLKACPHFNHMYGILTMFEDTPTEEEQMKRRNFSIHSLQERIKILSADRNKNELLPIQRSIKHREKRFSTTVQRLLVSSSSLYLMIVFPRVEEAKKQATNKLFSFLFWKRQINISPKTFDEKKSQKRGKLE